MEDMESHSCDADSEMLDDAAEQTCFAAVHSPVQVSPATDTEMSTELGCFTEPAGIPARHDLRSRPSVLGLDLGDHTAVRTVSPGRDVSSLPTTISRLEVGSKSNILAKIEGIFEGMVDVLLNERGQLNIAIMTRPSPPRQQLDLHGTTRSHGESVQQLCFPGKTEKEAWRFAVVTRILELMHEAISKDVVLSKRDIYYRDPALFGQQSHVDRYVDNIAYTFGVPRSALHVTAAAKGLVAGAVTFCRRDGTTVDASSDREGLLMPNLKDILSASMSSTKWILVVEKEATFRSIAASKFWATISTSGIMVTAKGYPDISTRDMLRFLSSPSPKNGFSAPAVYGMLDYDPDGIAILLTYKHGSQSLAHEAFHTRLPQIQCLGLRGGHVLSGKVTHADQGLLSLTARDRNKARKMLAWPIMEEEESVKRDLQLMLMFNFKAELQLLDATPNGMLDLLASSLPT